MLWLCVLHSLMDSLRASDVHSLYLVVHASHAFRSQFVLLREKSRSSSAAAHTMSLVRSIRGCRRSLITSASASASASGRAAQRGRARRHPRGSTNRSRSAGRYRPSSASR